MTVLDTPELALEKIGTIRPKKSAEIESSIFSIGFECLDRKLFNPEKCYDRAAETGVKWARCQTAWIRCEEHKKGVYTFDWLDDVVNNLTSRGIQVWFSIVFGNPLYMKNIPHPTAVGCTPTEFGPECMEAWLNYIRATVAHFKDRVHWWEVWNEPNGEQFWYPGKPSGEKYAAMVEAAEKAIHEVDPKAKITACCNISIGRFAPDALDAGIGNHADAVAIHPYAPVPEDIYPWRVEHLRGLLKKHGSSAVVWQGECGYPAQAFGHKDDTWLKLYNANETTQAKYVTRRMMTDLSLDISLSSYFHLADLVEGDYRTSDGVKMRTTMLGLLKTKEYLPKESFRAMRSMTALFDGKCKRETLELEINFNSYNQQLLGVLPILGIRRTTFVRNGWGIYTWYLAEDPQKEFSGTPDMSIDVLDETEHLLEQPVLFDPLSGNVFKITNFIRDFGGGRRVHFPKMPLTDYPLVLADRRALDILS